MGPGIFLLDMEGPVGLEVSASTQRSQPEDGLSSLEGPAGAGSSHAILDEVATSALDHTRRDGQPIDERPIVVQDRRVAEEVSGADFDRLTCLGGEHDVRRIPGCSWPYLPPTGPGAVPGVAVR